MNPVRLLAACVLAAVSCVSAAATYLVTDVAPYLGQAGIALNRHGVVTATMQTANGLRPFVFSGGKRHVVEMDADDAYAYAINDRGDVAGLVRSNHWADAFGFWWDGHQTRTIGDTDEIAIAYAINQSRQVAGTLRNSKYQQRAYLYADGVLADLGALGGKFSLGLAINNGGRVAGYYSPDGELVRAFIYDGLAMRDLGSLPGDAQSAAYALNDDGVVVGTSGPSASVFQAVRFHDGEVEGLGTLGGYSARALGINGRGHIVGWSGLAAGGEQGQQKELYTEAFIWRKGRMANLNGQLDATSGEGWVLHSAAAINDAGQIAGWGEHFGKKRVFLLMPAGSVVRARR